MHKHKYKLSINISINIYDIIDQKLIIDITEHKYIDI